MRLKWMNIGHGWSRFRLGGAAQKLITRPGKHTKNYGKSPFLMGKSTISMAIFNSYVCLPEGNGSMSFHHLFPFKTHVFAVGFCSRKLQLPHWPGRQESCSLTDPLLRSPEWLSLHRSSRLYRVYIHKHPHGMWPFVCVCVYLCIYILIYIYV